MSFFDDIHADSFKPTTNNLPDLVEEQLSAANRIHNENRHFILTGRAGSGKSTVIRYLCNQYPGHYCLAATTGRAAMIIDGVTIDSLFCFSRDDWMVWSWQYLDYVMQHCPRKVIIDEASMIGSCMARVIKQVADKYHRQIILVGDWAQASPVKDKWPFKSQLFRAAEPICLKKCHRQAGGKYLRALNDIRKGKVTERVSEVLGTRIYPNPPLSDKYLRLYATNKRVDAFNQKKLDNLVDKVKGEPFQFECTVTDMRTRDKQISKPLSADRKNIIVDASGLSNGEDLCVGCRILINRNSCKDDIDIYVNGDMGTLTGVNVAGVDTTITDPKTKIDPSLVESLVIEVERRNGNHTVQVRRQIVSHKNALGRDEYAVKGFPVRLGYAVTIHKSQGATVEFAWVDMDSILSMPDESRHGLAYVALSRTRKLSGLRISGLVPESIFCSERVRRSKLVV